MFRLIGVWRDWFRLVDVDGWGSLVCVGEPDRGGAVSVRVMAQVWDADLPPNHKLVLLAYADAADDDGTHAFPGEERLSQMTGYSVSQVRRVTRELIDTGKLVRVKRGHRGQRAEFAILEGAQSATHSRGESLANDAEKPSTHATPPILDPIREPNGSREPDISTDEIGSWTALEDLFGEVTTETERKRRGKIVRSLNRAGATFSEVKARAAAWDELFPPSNGHRVTLTDHALEKWWGQLGKVLADRPESFDPDACAHPEDRLAVIEDSTYCGVCRRELT